MKNRLPPKSDHLNLERPHISTDGLILTADARGFLFFQWVTPGGIFYEERYHVDTHKRVGWTFGKSIDVLSN